MENASDLFMETTDNPNDALTRNGDAKNYEKKIDIFNEVADTFAVHPHSTHTHCICLERGGEGREKISNLVAAKFVAIRFRFNLFRYIFTARRMEFHHRLECIFLKLKASSR